MNTVGRRGESERGWEGLNAVIIKRNESPLEVPCLFTVQNERGCAVAHTIILL